MLSRTTLLTATVLASAAALVGVGSTTAQAATEVHIYQYVQAHHSGKDLAVLNASTAPGQPIVQFTRNTGPNQQWEITSLPSSPAPGMAPDRQIKNRLSGLCLDVANNSTADGATVHLWDCIDTVASQKWTASNGQLVNPASGKCLDVKDNNPADGAKLQIWTCTGAANQKWSVPA